VAYLLGAELRSLHPNEEYQEAIEYVADRYQGWGLVQFYRNNPLAKSNSSVQRVVLDCCRNRTYEKKISHVI
jgi:hypothetical protein